MRTRRDLLKLSALAAAASCLPEHLAASPQGHKAAHDRLTYGVQLFMLRRQAVDDLPGVFKAIHDAGFAQVELYPIAYRLPPNELKRMVADAGLGSVAGHFDYVGLESKLDYAHALGLKFFVCPMLPREQWNSVEGFRQAATLFNKVGAGARERGMTFVFHNHDYEFKSLGNSNGFATLMQATDPALVKLEFDLYWLTQGGQDPAEMLRKYKDRAALIHMKDRSANAPVSYDMEKGSEHFMELGKGTIAWPALLRQAADQGIHYAFLDQDETAGPVPESMRISRAYLKTLHV